jgi:beta propeller repeat protein
MRKLIFAAVFLLWVIPCQAGIITVELETNVGDISVALRPEEAPITVKNFLGYVESGFYDGLIFHRVEITPTFGVIQGGGFDPNYERRDPCDPIINESYNGLSNVRGTIAMARGYEANSATSQFYINEKNNPSLDWQSPTDVGYCVFGEVVDGLNVVDAIAAEPVGEVNFPGEPEPRQNVPIGPNSPIIIYTARIIDSNHCWYNLAGDLDSSCEVDLVDFSLMAAKWLDSGSPQEFNKNEATNIDTHDLSGDIFIWEGDDDIYSYNLSDGNEFSVCTQGHLQRTPAISGHIVVWCDYRNYQPTTNPTDIYGADISNPSEPNEFDICTAAGGQMTPAIDGNIVVWDDYRNLRHDIYGYDLSTETEFPICIKISDQQQPDVSGNIVVWRDNRGGDYDIYGADITNPYEPNEFVICDANGDQKQPVISGDIVVWEDNRDPNLAIYGYDLSTDVEFFIVSGEIANCDVSGNIVVWQDKRNGEWDIYGYDVSTANEFVVSTADEMQIQPVISGGTVAWRDYRSLDNDLYWLRLCYLACDLNSDCTVDINDFSILASQWLDCNIDPPEFCW